MKHISWHILKYISIKWNAVLEFNHNNPIVWCNKYLVQWSNTSARGFTGRSSNPWSLESHNAWRLPAKIAPWNAESTAPCFIEHYRFATVLECFGPLCRSTWCFKFCFTLTASLAFAVASRSLSARSLCCALSATATVSRRPSDLCWSCPVL